MWTRNDDIDPSRAPQGRPTLSEAQGRGPWGRGRLATATVIAAALAGLLTANTIAVSSTTAAATTSATVRVGGTELHVRQEGPTSAPVVVLLHGLGGSSRWWDEIIPGLARTHRVVVIDLLGHGRSAKPGGDRYAVPDHARLVGEALTAIGVTEATVVGHSTGGYVATSLAEHRPALVSGIVLIGTGPSRSAYSGGPTGDLLATPVAGQLLWRLRTDGLLRNALSSAVRDPDRHITPHMIDDLRGVSYHALTATSRGAHAYLELQPMPPRLSALGTPLLVIGGAEDVRWRPASYSQYASVPESHVDVVSGVGHSPMLEDPARTSSMILWFLSAPDAR